MTKPDISLPPGYQLAHFENIDSTSAEARRLAHSGAGAGLWVLADHQSGGKGRQGRVWHSLPGNLFASLLLYPACDLKRLPELSFVTAIAVAAAFRDFTRAEVTCKWPNDVLLGGKKAAGILLEAENSGNPQKPWVIIGIGMNIAATPDHADYPAAALKDFSENPPDRDTVFAALADHLAGALTRWAKDGFQPIRTLWLNQASGMGRTVKVETGGRVISGKMKGLSGGGALVLEDKDGKTVEIISGTVLKDS